MSTASDDVPPELPKEYLDRLKAALERLNPEGARIGLAVSGGPDSMAMLLLAHAAIPGGFEVATVDHGLRPEAKDECALVVAACEARGVPCEVLTVEVEDGNLQSLARYRRYEALAQWARRRDIHAVATAHHADDQAETFLMRLNRGSGVSGLAGIRETALFEGNPPLRVIRPLLTFRRWELGETVAACGAVFANDPSNDDDRFDRVRIRKALAEAGWLDVDALVRSAGLLAEVDDGIEQITDRALRDYSERRGDVIELVPPPDRIVAQRLTERIITWFGGKVRGSEVARLLDDLAVGKGGNIGGVLVTEQDGMWLFRPEPPRRAG